MISSLLAQITSLLTTDFPELKASLNPPATDNQIQSAERQIGRPWPEDLKNLYRLHDGQSENGGLFWGLPFLSVDQALSEWRTWKQIADEGIAALDNEIVSFPTGAIKEVYANQYYIPISKDFGGNNIGIDLDPDTGGTAGQVINFGRDEFNRYVIAPSLTEFLKFMLAQIQSGNVVIVEQDSVKSWRLKNSNKSHFLDALKDLTLPVGSALTTVVAPSDAEAYAAWFSKLSAPWQAIVNKSLRSGTSGFAGLSKVATLMFIREGISDLTPLEKFPGLRELVASANPVRDIMPLKHLPELKKLYLAHTLVDDLQALSCLPNLGQLSLSGLPLRDISCLNSLKKLKSLGLQGCTLSDLESVSQLSNLTELDIRDNQFPAFECLQKLKNLKDLDLAGTNVADLSFLAHLKKLTTLRIYETPVRDFSVLRDLPNLRDITCGFAEFLIIKDLMPRKMHFTISGKMTEAQRNIYSNYVMPR